MYEDGTQVGSSLLIDFIDVACAVDVGASGHEPMVQTDADFGAQLGDGGGGDDLVSAIIVNLIHRLEGDSFEIAILLSPLERIGVDDFPIHKLPVPAIRRSRELQNTLFGKMLP